VRSNSGCLFKQIRFRFDEIVCGRVIGKSSGWDQSDIFMISLYDFEPNAGYKGPVGNSITIDFENGNIRTYDDDGNITQQADLIEAIRERPRKE